MKTKNDWLERLSYAAKDIPNDKIKDVLNYVKWVKIKKLNNDFIFIFSKFKG